MLVDPYDVSPTRYDNSGVRRMKKVLQAQGQIEPLQVSKSMSTFDKDPWGGDIVVAARELGWKTILVVVMDRYEQ